MYRTFEHYEYYPEGMKLPVEYQIRFLHVVSPKYVVSSAIGT